MHYNKLMDVNGYVHPEKIKKALFGLEEKTKMSMFYFNKFNEQYKSKVEAVVTRTTYLLYKPGSTTIEWVYGRDTQG